MQTVIDLGKKVKAKYPGQYDDLSDDDVGRKVKAKFPGAYDDFADSPVAQAAAPVPQSDDRTATQVMMDQMDKVSHGIPKAITGIPGALWGAAGIAKDALMGNAQAAVQGVTGIAKGLVQPYAASAQGAAALAYPSDVKAPSREEFEQAAEGAGINMGGILLGEGVSAAKPMVSRAVAPVAKSAADYLRESAQGDVKRILNPTTKGNKVLTERVAPKLADSGPIAATLKGYQAKVAAQKAAAGEALGEAHANVPEQKMIQTKGIIDSIEQSKFDHEAIIDGEHGPVVVEPDLVAAADKLKGIVQEFGPEVSYRSMVKLRQRWDRTVAKAKGFVQPDVGAAIDMKREAASAIREELAREAPSVAKINAEYSFWSNADKVIGDTVTRKTGQALPLGEQLATAAGMAGGLATGGIGTAIESAAAARGLTKVFRSTAWRSVSARLKSRMADALASGDAKAVQAAVEEVRAAMPAAAALPRESENVAVPDEGEAVSALRKRFRLRTD